MTPQPPAAEIQETAQRILSERPYGMDDAAYGIDLSWLFDLWGRLMEFLFSPLEGASPVVLWVLASVLILVLLALLAHIVYSFYAALRTPQEGHYTVREEVMEDPADLERRAEAFAASQNYVDATRTLLLAALTALERKRGGRVRPGWTNLEYLRSFRTPWVIDTLRVLVDLINWKWYRDRSFDAADYDRCRAAYQRLRARLDEVG